MRHLIAALAICFIGCSSDYRVPARLSLTNSLNMTFRRIEAASFTMGSPLDEPGRSTDETPHWVTLSRSFWMQTTHVTVAQWRQFTKATGYKTQAEREGWGLAWTGTKWEKTPGASWQNPGFHQEDDHPVVNVSWNDAMAFCNWLGQTEHRHYRLPTEAEYEYCCRAGATTAFPWGDNPENGKGWANCADQSAKARYPDWSAFNWSDGYIFTSPVAHYQPNALGLYDLIGNAWEWCSDWYGPYPTTNATDPQGPTETQATTFPASPTTPAGPQRVMRGGSWHSAYAHARSANRDHESPDFRNCIKGFRLVMDIQP